LRQQGARLGLKLGNLGPGLLPARVRLTQLDQTTLEQLAQLRGLRADSNAPRAGVESLPEEG
jgi:hypothetical protein